MLPRKRKKKYSVKASLGNVELPKNTGSAISVDVFATGWRKKLGTLWLGQGSIHWYTKYAKTTAKPTKPLNWSRFAELMDNTNIR